MMAYCPNCARTVTLVRAIPANRYSTERLDYAACPVCDWRFAIIDGSPFEDDEH